jgi:hypothetical protein
MTGPEVEPTDDAAVQAAEARVRKALDDLVTVQDSSPQDQVEAYAAAQRTLQATLSDIDND